MDKVLTFKLYLMDIQSKDVNPKTVNNDVKSVFTNYFSKSGEFNDSMKNLVDDFMFVKSEPLEFGEDGIVVRIIFKTSSEDEEVLDALEVWGEKTANQVDELLDHELIMSLISSGRSAPTIGIPDTDPTTPGGRRSKKTSTVRRRITKKKRSLRSKKTRKSRLTKSRYSSSS